MYRGQFHLFSTRSGKPYADKVIQQLEHIINIRDKELSEKEKKEKLSPYERDERQFIDDTHYSNLHVGNAEIQHFEDDEMNPVIDQLENVRDKDVYLIQASYTTTNNFKLSQNVMESFFFIDALVRAKATNINVISLYWPYSRGDKQHGKDAVPADLYARLMTEAGMTGLLTFDLHADQIAGFFDPKSVKLEHLHASPLILHYVNNYLEKGSVCAPDAGAAKRAQFYAKKLGVDVTMAYKRRSYKETHKVDELQLLGEPDEGIVLVVDDLVASGGSVEKVIEKLAEKGVHEAYVAATHPLLVKNALPNFDAMYKDKKHPFKGLITTDAILHKQEILENEWYHEIDTSRFVAKAIYEMHTSGSLTPLHEPSCIEQLGLWVGTNKD